MGTHEIKVTTTSTFEGIQVEEYMEPITAHLVIGMNFFKDFLSSFTDFFGGKSQSYQKTLESINKEAINLLRSKASSLGANCIVGLKIDNDEISAQGKSMLMVTAIGTPAKAKFKEDKSSSDKAGNGEMGIELFNILEQKRNFIEDSKNDSLNINDAFWDFIKRHQVIELADFLIKQLEQKLKYQPQDSPFEKEISEYFSQIEETRAKKIIYEYLAKNDLSIKVKEALCRIIATHNFLEFNLVRDLLNLEDRDTKKLALSLLRGRKSHYQNDDKAFIRKIISELPDRFPIRVTYTSKKKALTGKQKDIWICQCQRENEVEEAYCNKCGKDARGFRGHEMNPTKATEELEKTLQIIEEVL